jgi:hypothetical protein
MGGPIQDLAEDDFMGTRINDTTVSNYMQVEHEFYADNITNLNAEYPITIGNSGIDNLLITITGPVISKNLYINHGTTEIVPGISQSNFYITTTSGLLQSINTTGKITTYQPINDIGQLVTFSNSLQTQVPLNLGSSGYVLMSKPDEDLGLKWTQLGTIANGRTLLNYINNTDKFITNSVNFVPYISLGTTEVFPTGNYYVLYDFTLLTDTDIRITINAETYDVISPKNSGFLLYSLPIDSVITIQTYIKVPCKSKNVTVSRGQLILYSTFDIFL